MLSAEADKTCRDLDNYGYYEKTELNILYTLKVSNKHKAGFCTRVPVHWNRYKRPNNTLQLTEENAMVKKRKQRKCNGYSLVHRYTRTQLKAAMKDIVPQRIFKPRSNKVFFLSSFVVLFLLRYFWNINLSMSFLWFYLGVVNFLLEYCWAAVNGVMKIKPKLWEWLNSDGSHACKNLSSRLCSFLVHYHVTQC